MLEHRYLERYLNMLHTLPQAFGCLRNEEGFDPLGLLCQLHSELTDTPWDISKTATGLHYSYLECQYVLPDEVRLYFNLSTHDPIITQDKTLSMLNDQGLSLKYLAFLIRKM